MNFTGQNWPFVLPLLVKGLKNNFPPFILGFQGVVVPTAISYQHLTNWFHQTEYNMHTLGQAVVLFERMTEGLGKP